MGAALRFAARRLIPNRPRLPSRLRQWAEEVKNARALLEGSSSGQETTVELLQRMRRYDQLGR